MLTIYLLLVIAFGGMLGTAIFIVGLIALALLAMKGAE